LISTCKEQLPLTIKIVVHPKQCKAVSSQLRGNPKPQTALNEHPADNETKGKKSLRRFRVVLLTKSSKMRRRIAGE
jgi:hypothetical protein